MRRFALLLLVFTCPAIRLAVIGAEKPVRTVLRAAGDFRPVSDPAFAASYAETRGADPAMHGLAVNPKIAQDRFAAAETSFGGDDGIYLIRLHATAEEDGESVYELVVDGKNLGQRTNSRVSEKRVPVTHTWEKVRLTSGMQVRVLFAGRSNGLHPEGPAYAWSRGRWRSVEIVRTNSIP
jgi:hypothetical protein